VVDHPSQAKGGPGTRAPTYDVLPEVPASHRVDLYKADMPRTFYEIHPPPDMLQVQGDTLAQALLDGGWVSVPVTP